LVCLVDPKPGEQRQWEALAQANGLHIEVVESAEMALRQAHRQRIDLWVVNTQLPGLSGCELCGMLRAQGNRAPIHLVADTYSAEEERAAYAARATSFRCIPLEQSVVDTCLVVRRARHCNSSGAANDPL
jgi:two-component system response regulator MprA